MNTSVPNKHQIRDAQDRYLAAWATQCDYAITLQTWLPSQGCAVRDDMRRKILRDLKPGDERRQFVSRSVNYLRNRLNRVLTGNGSRRNPAYMPTFCCTIEGTTGALEFNKTIHVHACIGNLPVGLDIDMLEDAIRQIWEMTDAGVNDIVVKAMLPGQESGWGSYCNKEAHQGNLDCMDATNLQASPTVLASIELLNNKRT